ncbi:MAG: PAS domain-containing protein [Pirellulales bacterium]|nr:PAS domain-containing protein [Pirellulales bacterium]
MRFERLRRRHGGVFWRLFLSLAALSAVPVAVLALVVSSAYQGLLWRQVDEELRAAAAVSAALLAERWPAAPAPEAQARIKAAGAQAGVRLTLIGLDGRVLADSRAADAAAVRAMESHANRQEIAAAIHNGQGAARRQSPTLGEPFAYHAIRVDAAEEPLGVVRAALPLAPLAAEIAGVHRWLYAVAAVLALASALVAYLLAARLADPMRTLADTARALVSGQYDRRPAMAMADARSADEVEALAAALHDIGKRLAHSEGQLRSTRGTQETILEGMSESVIAVNRAERILFANAAAGRLLGFNPLQVHGRTLLEAVRNHQLRDVMLQARSSRTLARAELAWRAQPSRTFDVLATPLPGNPPAGVVLVLRDVSELKRLEQLRQQFFANVSHELKTPLSSIRAYTETLLDGASRDAANCERFLKRIDEQAGRLQQLIADMLSLARIESSQAPLEIVDLPLGRVVERCAADFEPQAAARRVALETTIDGQPRARADEEAVRQILANLMDNAIKYTPAGGRVAVRARLEGGAAVLEVADTGPGIPAEHHARVFERFYRVDKARSRQLGGTGLGLSIVKHLAHAMGGSVSLASDLGAGSVFSVRLPAAAGGERGE